MGVSEAEARAIATQVRKTVLQKRAASGDEYAKAALRYSDQPTKVYTRPDVIGVTPVKEGRESGTTGVYRKSKSGKYEKVGEAETKEFKGVVKSQQQEQLQQTRHKELILKGHAPVSPGVAAKLGLISREELERAQADKRVYYVTPEMAKQAEELKKKYGRKIPPIKSDKVPVEEYLKQAEYERLKELEKQPPRLKYEAEAKRIIETKKKLGGELYEKKVLTPLGLGEDQVKGKAGGRYIARGIIRSPVSMIVEPGVSVAGMMEHAVKRPKGFFEVLIAGGKEAGRRIAGLPQWVMEHPKEAAAEVAIAGTQILAITAIPKAYRYIKVHTAKKTQEIVSHRAFVDPTTQRSAEQAKVLQKVGKKLYVGEVESVSKPSKLVASKQIAGGKVMRDVSGRTAVHRIKVAEAGQMWMGDKTGAVPAKFVSITPPTKAVGATQSFTQKLSERLGIYFEKGKIITERGKTIDIAGKGFFQKFFERTGKKLVEGFKPGTQVMTTQEARYASIGLKLAKVTKGAGAVGASVRKGMQAAGTTTYILPVKPTPSIITGTRLGTGLGAKLGTVSKIYPAVTKGVLKGVEKIATQRFAAGIKATIKPMPIVSMPSARIITAPSQAYFSKVGTIAPKTTARVVRQKARITPATMQAYTTKMVKDQAAAARALAPGLQQAFQAKGRKRAVSISRLQAPAKMQAQMVKQAQLQLQKTISLKTPRMRVVPTSPTFLTPRVYPGSPFGYVPVVRLPPGYTRGRRGRLPYWMYGLRLWPVMSGTQALGLSMRRSR